MDLTRFVERATPLRVLNVLVSQNGELIGKYDWEGDIRRNAYSASKSFTSAAVGIAQKEGLLSIDEKLVDAFKEDLPDIVSPELEAATVRDLLTMSLGQEHPHLMGEQRPHYPETDWVKLSLSLPFTSMPGETFLYNNVGPYLAGILVQRRAGQSLTAYLEPRLFTPLGIRHTVWEEDPLGCTFGAGGLFICTEELHRFGQLYLQEGNWNGKQLIPAEWVRESLSIQGAANPHNPYGYGYLFWGGPEGTFRADGKYCQLSIICRDKNAVISMMSECRDEGTLMKAIFEEIWPQL